MPFEPLGMDADVALKRTLLLTAEIYESLYIEYPTKLENEHFAAVRAQFIEFVTGEVIVDDQKRIKRISHADDAIWQIRVLLRPGARYGGGFPLVDTFVVVSAKPRERLLFSAWKADIDKFWEDLLPGHDRYQGWPLAACICNVREP